MKPLNLNRKTFSLHEFRTKLSEKSAHWNTIKNKIFRPTKVPISFSNGSSVLVNTNALNKISQKVSQLAFDGENKRLGGHYNIGGVVVSTNIFTGNTRCIVNKDIPIGNSIFNNVWFSKLASNKIQYQPKYLTSPNKIIDFHNRDKSIFDRTFNGITQKKVNSLTKINKDFNSIIGKKFQSGLPIHEADRIAFNKSIRSLRGVLVPGGLKLQAGMEPNLMISTYKTRLNVHKNYTKNRSDRAKFINGFNNFMGTNF